MFDVGFRDGHVGFRDGHVALEVECGIDGGRCCCGAAAVYGSGGPGCLRSCQCLAGRY